MRATAAVSEVRNTENHCTRARYNDRDVWIFLLLFWAHPASFDEILRGGLEALQKNDLKAARERLEEASKLKPRDGKVLLGLARTYWRLNLPDLARAAADKAESYDGENAVVLHGLAYFYSEAGDPGRAAPLEARYADMIPDDTESLPRAASLYLQAGEPKPAIELARKALARQDRASVHSLLGQAYEMDGRIESAEAEMQAAIRTDAYQETYYFDLGRLYLLHENAARAAAVFEDGRKVFARSAQLELAQGVADYSLRRFDDAADCFLRTIQIAPNAEQPYMFLSRMLDQVEDKLPRITAASAEFAKTKPESYLANFVYAKALSAGGGDPQQVEGLLAKSIALNGKFWESRAELARQLERRHDLEASGAEYRRAIDLAPTNADLHYHLARIYERLGKKDDAAAEYTAHKKFSGAEPLTRRQQDGLTIDLRGK